MKKYFLLLALGVTALYSCDQSATLTDDTVKPIEAATLEPVMIQVTVLTWADEILPVFDGEQMLEQSITEKAPDVIAMAFMPFAQRMALSIYDQSQIKSIRVFVPGDKRTLRNPDEQSVECFCYVPSTNNPECDSGGAGSSECSITDGDTGDSCQTKCYNHTAACCREKE